MKPITEIDDARLVKGLAHPLRIHILRVLDSRVASPSEIASEINAPLGNVSYHVRFLARVGLIELAGTEPRRGAVEHYYRAVGRIHVSDKAWAQVPQLVKDALLSSTLGQIGRRIADAAPNGGFDRDESHVSRRSIMLDARGFAELAAAIEDFLERANAIERDSAERLAGSEPANSDVNAELVTMLFEAPRGGAGQPPTNVPRRRRAARG